MSTNKAYIDELLAITVRYGKYATEALQGFNAVQNRLELSSVIDLENLMQPKSRALAKHKLSNLEKAFEVYKKVYEKYIISMSKELLAATALLPEPERTSEAGILASKIQEQVDEQSRFYAARTRWIESAYKLSKLVKVNEASIFVEDGELVCSDENALEDISAVLEIINICAQAESEIMLSRSARITSGLGFFGAKIA